MINPSEILWFPMRVRYSSAKRLLMLKELLDKEETVVGTYIPMRFQKIDDKMQEAPVINNLIFVRITYDHLREIKQKVDFIHLRYIMHPVTENDMTRSEVLYVPERQMNDFIRVTSENSEKVIYLDNLEFACKPGQRVQITEGTFVGVEGVIKRIQGNVCVVVPIKDTIAAAITGIPKKYLRLL